MYGRKNSERKIWSLLEYVKAIMEKKRQEKKRLDTGKGGSMWYRKC